MESPPPGGARKARGVRALGAVDRVLLLALLPLWAASFSLHVREAVRSRLVWPWVWVERAPDAATGPRLLGVWPQFEELAEGLEPGDRIVTIGERSAAGLGPVDFVAAALASADAEQRVPLRVERAGEILPRTLRLGASPVPWVFAAISLAFAATAALILLYAPRARAARPAFLAGIAYGLYYAFFYGPDPWQTYVSLAMLVATGSLTGPLAVRGMMALSETRSGPLPRWPWLLALAGPLYSSLILGTPLSPELAQTLFPLGTAALVACLTAVVVQDYRAADAVGRRKLRWVLYGVYLGTFPFGLGWLAYLFDPALLPLTLYSLAAALFIPLGFLVAIVRHNLLDIDRLISATASYSILSVLIVAGALTLVPRASRAASSALGVNPDAGQLVLSLALAAIAVPLQRRLRPRIDRVFFAERAQIDRAARELLAELSSSDSARALVECVGRGLAHTFRPEACVVYVRGERSYLPLFVAGGSAAPAVPLDSPLVDLLDAHAEPVLILDPEPRALRELGGRERAMLESLAALAIVPVSVGGALTAFACLGAKRSGDVYTSTDLAWLVALREGVRRELRRLDHSELLREAERRKASFRRYVPGAIAEELESGADLEVGEREVSVLFVDIRGYTAYAEGREAEEIFSTINRYTHVVSQLVRAHGGSVVEFNGDGMMAVFGAPRELPAKERAAVDAGLAIVAAVAGLAVSPSGERLSAGVGIATGQAYVGNIRAEDRLIWSAIGNTTNLAARLQTLTRELEASVVIDVATWKGAGESAASFREHAAVRIRNRTGTQTVYVRSL
jgi:class 3 adenylate cyclase